MKTPTRSGHATVDAMEEISFQGNITPRSWYSHERLRTAAQKPNFVAITLLADIVYWYRPTIIQDETGQVRRCKRKFDYHRLYKNYSVWAKEFGMTKRQVQEAVSFLVKRGLIIREVRPFTFENGTAVGAVVFLEPVAAAIEEITSDVSHATSKSDPPVSSRHNERGVTSKSEEDDTPKRRPTQPNVRGVTLERDPYTKTSAGITSKIPTINNTSTRSLDDVDDVQASSREKAATPHTGQPTPMTPVDVLASLDEEQRNAAQALREVGVSLAVAVELATEVAAPAIFAQIDWLATHTAELEERGKPIRNPAAFLIRAIRDQWSKPASIQKREDAQAAAQKAKIEAAQIARHDEEMRRDEREQRQREDEDRCQLNARLEAMSESDKEALDQAIAARFPHGDLTSIFGKGVGEVAMQGMKRELLREGWTPPLR